MMYQHFLSIEVFEVQPPPNIPILRFIGPLDNPLEMSTDNPQGVMAFMAANRADPLDYGWILDVYAIHPGATVDNNGVQPNNITLFDGILHSSMRSRPGVSLEKQQPPLQCRDVNFVTILIGVSIKLNGRTFFIKWAGSSTRLWQSDPTKQYMIYVSNARSTPPPILTCGVGDLGDYYMSLGNVNPQDKRNLRFCSCGLHPRDTTRVPCMSVLFNG